MTTASGTFESRQQVQFMKLHQGNPFRLELSSIHKCFLQLQVEREDRRKLMRLIRKIFRIDIFRQTS